MEEPDKFMNPPRIVTYLPHYAQEGNTLLRRWEEPFEDRNGNKAILTFVEYQDKKKKVSQAVILVKWLL